MVFLDIVGALLVIVTAFLADKASEKLRKPLWVLFILLVAGQTSLQVYSRLRDSSEMRKLKAELIHADVKFDHMLPADLLPVAPGSVKQFNVYTANNGNETATDLVDDTKMYFGTPGDREQEKEFDADFEEWWRREPIHHKSPWHHSGSRSEFYTTHSPPLTAETVEQMKAQTLTMYILMRTVYSDHTGRWQSDSCFYFQDPIHDLIVGHPCTVHNSEREAVKQ